MPYVRELICSATPRSDASAVAGAAGVWPVSAGSRPRAAEGCVSFTSTRSTRPKSACARNARRWRICGTPIPVSTTTSQDAQRYGEFDADYFERQESYGTDPIDHEEDVLPRGCRVTVYSSFEGLKFRLPARCRRAVRAETVIRVCPASCACHSVSEGAASNSQGRGPPISKSVALVEAW
jgi:hypothetical protein